MANFKSFDEMLVKAEPSEVKKARLAYEDLAKKVSTTPTDEKDYSKLRTSKLDAAKAYSNARQAAEADFYKEPVTEIKANVAAFKEEQAKKVGAPAPVVA